MKEVNRKRWSNLYDVQSGEGIKDEEKEFFNKTFDVREKAEEEMKDKEGDDEKVDYEESVDREVQHKINNWIESDGKSDSENKDEVDYSDEGSFEE